MPTMNNVNWTHSSKIMKGPVLPTVNTCDWRQKTDCPKDSNCLSEWIILKASVNTNKLINICIRNKPSERNEKRKI